MQMENEICVHTIHKWPCIRIIMCSSDKVIYSECGLLQPFLFRIQLYKVRVSVCKL